MDELEEETETGTLFNLREQIRTQFIISRSWMADDDIDKDTLRMMVMSLRETVAFDAHTQESAPPSESPSN